MAGEAGRSDRSGEEGEEGMGTVFVVVLTVVVGLVVGVGGWYFDLLPHRASEAGIRVEGAAPSSARDLGAFSGLDPFVVNLSDDAGARYLRATVQLEFWTPRAPREMARYVPEIRDRVLTLLASKRYADVGSPEGKAALRDEIVTRINTVLRQDLVKTVHFTEFVVLPTARGEAG